MIARVHHRWDLAWAANRFVPLYRDEDCPALGIPVQPRGPRLRRFLDAYGLDEREGFIPLIHRRVQALSDTVRALAEAGDPAFGPLWRDTRGEQWLRRLRYIESQRADWERHLAG